jgi:hypothetical protein
VYHKPTPWSRRCISIDGAVLLSQPGKSLSVMQTALGGHMIPLPHLSRSPFNFYVDLLFWGPDTRANIEANLPMYMAMLREACAHLFSIGGESVRILIICTTDGGLAYAYRAGSPNNSLHPQQTSHINKHDSKNQMKVAGWTTTRLYRDGVATLQLLSGASHKELKKHVFPYSFGITGFSLNCTSDELTCVCSSHLKWRLVICQMECVATQLRLKKKLTAWETCINKHLGIKCVLTSNRHALYFGDRLKSGRQKGHYRDNSGTVEWQ